MGNGKPIPAPFPASLAMPILVPHPRNRRAFLKVATLGGAALFVTGRRTLASPAPLDSSVPDFHLALLSDTHIPADRNNAYRGFRPWENLARIVPDMAAVRPQAAILCGDAARLEGRLEDYEQLKDLLEPLAAVTPVHIALGNHDDRANFLRVFPPRAAVHHPAVGGKHVTVIEFATLRVLVLDSLLYVDKVAGLLGRNQREWLARYLPQLRDRPAVLFVHHTLGDGDGDLLDADRLFALLEPHPHVKAIFFGHSHVWQMQQRGRLQLINLPAVGYNFRDQDPVGWVEARFHPEGVALTLHAFGGNRADDGKTTTLSWL